MLLAALVFTLMEASIAFFLHMEKHQVTFHWVKGHAENPKNNRCDELAVSEWKKRK